MLDINWYVNVLNHFGIYSLIQYFVVCSKQMNGPMIVNLADYFNSFSDFPQIWVSEELGYWITKYLNFYKYNRSRLSVSNRIRYDKFNLWIFQI